ncbi:MAG TPA: hypothetical protein VM009_02235 [Terriglobales bacterium]|nr:hypothetical protein [Terriglobales bacterium]
MGKRLNRNKETPSVNKLPPEFPKTRDEGLRLILYPPKKPVASDHKIARYLKLADEALRGRVKNK